MSTSEIHIARRLISFLLELRERSTAVVIIVALRFNDDWLTDRSLLCVLRFESIGTHSNVLDSALKTNLFTGQANRSFSDLCARIGSTRRCLIFHSNESKNGTAARVYTSKQSALSFESVPRSRLLSQSNEENLITVFFKEKCSDDVDWSRVIYGTIKVIVDCRAVMPSLQWH